jgi:hypothetical protein
MGSATGLCTPPSLITESFGSSNDMSGQLTANLRQNDRCCWILNCVRMYYYAHHDQSRGQLCDIMPRPETVRSGRYKLIRPSAAVQHLAENLNRAVDGREGGREACMHSVT